MLPSWWSHPFHSTLHSKGRLYECNCCIMHYIREVIEKISCLNSTDLADYSDIYIIHFILLDLVANSVYNWYSINCIIMDGI